MLPGRMGDPYHYAVELSILKIWLWIMMWICGASVGEPKKETKHI